MGTFTSYAQNKFLDHCLDGNTWTMPTVYIALSTTDFTVGGASGTEPVAMGYARQAIAADFGAAASRASTNTGDIVFPEATGSWGSIGYWALFDALTTGNCLAFGSFSSAKTVASGQTAKILTGELTVSIPASNGMTTYLANEFLDHVLGEGSYTPETVYVCLTTAIADGDAGTFTEVANSGAYARVAHAAWGVSTNTADNTGAITFTTATASWGTVSGVVLATSGTYGGGNELFYGTFDASSAVDTDDQAIIADGAFDFTMN